MSIYSETLVLNKHWTNYILKTHDYKYNYAIGAYRSSKSVSNTLGFALYLEETEDKLHLVIASTVATARAIVEDGDGRLGLKQYFASNYSYTKYKGYDAGKIKTPTGTKIVVYLGGSMESSYKCFRGWSVGGIVLEEANLLHTNTINEAKGRILMAKNPKVFISHNPTSKTAPIYQWLNELQEKDLVNFDRSTIYDNPALTDERRNEIISEFDPSSIFYKQYILGEDVDAEGQLFTIYDYNKLESFNPDDYISYVIVADTGETLSKTVFGCFALRYDVDAGHYCMDLVKEYEHLNRIEKEHNKKMPRDYANDLAEFKIECFNIFGRWSNNIIIDDSWAFFAEVKAAFIDRQLDIKSLTRPKKIPDMERIKKISGLLFNHQLNFYNADKTIDCLNNLQIDKKALLKNKLQIDNDFSIAYGHWDNYDIVSYAIEYYYDKLHRHIKT